MKKEERRKDEDSDRFLNRMNCITNGLAQLNPKILENDLYNL